MLFVERAFVTLFGPKTRLKIGVIASFAMVVMTFYFVIAIDPKSYQNDRVACVSGLTLVDTSINWRMIWNILYDIAITVLEFLLLIWNRYKMKKYRTYVLI